MAWYDKIRQNKLATALVVLTPVFGGIVAFGNVTETLDRWGFPRPMFVKEFQDGRREIDNHIRSVRDKIHDLEQEYRERSIRVDQRSLREVNAAIDQLIQEGKTMPDYLLDLRQTLTDSIQLNQRILDELRKG